MTNPTSKDGQRLNLDRALPEDMAHATAAREWNAVPTMSQERILTDTEMRQLERENLVRALTQTNWKLSGARGAAELQGLHPNTLSSRMKSLGIERPRSTGIRARPLASVQLDLPSSSGQP
jgi:transcriptional regulator with GAF, ATPase, and Fis domain